MGRAIKCILCWWIPRINCTASRLALSSWDPGILRLGSIRHHAASHTPRFLPALLSNHSSLPAVLQTHLSGHGPTSGPLELWSFCLFDQDATFSERPSLRTRLKNATPHPAPPHCPAFSPTTSHTAGFTCLPAPLPSRDLHDGRDYCLCVHCGISNAQNRI